MSNGMGGPPPVVTQVHFHGGPFNGYAPYDYGNAYGNPFLAVFGDGTVYRYERTGDDYYLVTEPVAEPDPEPTPEEPETPADPEPEAPADETPEYDLQNND